jgi:class 3 adenylate cyclase
MRADLPEGPVTFLFTDVEGSTRLLHQLGESAYADALAEHRRVLREAFGRHGGIEVDTQGDAFFFAFDSPHGALEAAEDGDRGLRSGPIRVRVGIHTGSTFRTAEGYVGADVHRAARIAAAGSGGQILVSLERALAQGSDLDLARALEFAVETS